MTKSEYLQEQIAATEEVIHRLINIIANESPPTTRQAVADLHEKWQGVRVQIQSEYQQTIKDKTNNEIH